MSIKIYDNSGILNTVFTSAVPQVTGVRAQVDQNKVNVSWYSIYGVRYYVYVNRVSDNELVTTLILSENSVLIELDDKTSYYVRVSGKYANNEGPLSDPVIFKTDCAIEGEEEDINCDKPLVLAIQQDSNINNPAIGLGVSTDVSVQLTNYNSHLSYIIDIYKDSSEIATSGKIITAGDDETKGKVSFTEVPPGDYKVVITSYLNSIKYCSNIIMLTDNSVPAPTNMSFINTTDTKTTVRWDAPVGREPISYELYVDDELYNVVGCVELTIEDLTGLTSYDIKVRAKYGMGVYSEYLTGTVVTEEEPLP